MAQKYQILQISHIMYRIKKRIKRFGNDCYFFLKALSNSETRVKKRRKQEGGNKKDMKRFNKKNHF